MSSRPTPTLAVICAVLAALAGTTACLSSRTTPAPAPAAAVAGQYAASLALTGARTYTGTLDLTAQGADSVRGNIRLTAPIAVDVILRGVARRDSLVLAGNYTGSNGCSGDFRASLAMSQAGMGTGPFQLDDRCAGALSGTMSVSR